MKKLATAGREQLFAEIILEAHRNGALPWQPIIIDARYYWNEAGTSGAIRYWDGDPDFDDGRYSHAGRLYRSRIHLLTTKAPWEKESGREFRAYDAGSKPEAADIRLKGTFGT